MRGGRHFLQQCRIYRHVRPRDDRSRCDACAYGPAQARTPSLRDAGRRWSAWNSSTTARRRSRISRAIVSPKPSRSRSRVWEPCAETSPGAATGSSSLRTRPAISSLANVGRLTEAATAIQRRASAQGVRGKDGALIDHIEFFGPARSSDANSRNFVLCPGGAYDRSPCGTGTSAKLACLAADGKLRPGEVWVQESIIGSRFRTSFEPGPNGGVLPRITGRAFVCAESKLVAGPEGPVPIWVRRSAQS